MERKQWMEALGDKGPALAGMGFLLLCLYLTTGVSLPFWHAGQLHQQKAAEYAREKQQVEQFARSFDPAKARDQKIKAERLLQLPAPKDGMEAMHAVHSLAERAHVKVRSCRPLPMEKKKDHFPLELTLTGDYVQLLVFFRQWEQDMPLAWWENGHIEATQTGALTFRGTVCFMKT